MTEPESPCVDCWARDNPGEPYPDDKGVNVCVDHLVEPFVDPLAGQMAEVMGRFTSGPEVEAPVLSPKNPEPVAPDDTGAAIPTDDDPEPSTPGEALAARIQRGTEVFIKSLRRPPRSHPTNRASELGHPCVRYLTYLRTHGEQAEPPGDTLQLIFEEGHRHESDIRRWLLDYCAVDLYGTQGTFPPNDYQISGHTDGTVMVAFGGKARRVGIEVKGVNGAHYQRLNDWTDIKNHSAPFIAKWYPQAQTYMFLDDLPEWVFVLKNKWTGERKPIVAPFEPDYTEGLIDKAEAVNATVAGGGCTSEAPEYLTNPVTCRRCKFFRVCAPPLEFGEGAILHDPPEFVGMLRRYNELEEGTREGKKLWEEIKEYVGALLGGKETRDIIAGDFLVHTSVGPSGKSMRTTVELIEKEGAADA